MSPPPGLVVDTSVAAKWFFDEPYTPEALDLLQTLRDERRRALAPDLIYAEFTNAVWKRVVRYNMSVDDGADIVAAFTHLPLTIAPSFPLLQSAYRLAAEYAITAYDALFVAVSQQTAAVLVTCDAALFRATETLGCVRLLSEWDR